MKHQQDPVAPVVRQSMLRAINRDKVFPERLHADSIYDVTFLIHYFCPGLRQ